MRESLRRSQAHTPAKGFERYPHGSVVICNACARPIFKLDSSIALGDKCGQAARAFKPLGVADLLALANREDIDAGVLAMVRTMTLDEMRAHCEKLHEVKTGDPMICPCCKDCFVQVLSTERNETLDKSYVLELVTIPPSGKVTPIRGKRLGYGPGKEWIN